MLTSKLSDEAARLTPPPRSIDTAASARTPASPPGPICRAPLRLREPIGAPKSAVTASVTLTSLAPLARVCCSKVTSPSRAKEPIDSVIAVPLTLRYGPPTTLRSIVVVPTVIVVATPAAEVLIVNVRSPDKVTPGTVTATVPDRVPATPAACRMNPPVPSVSRT